MTFSNGSLLVTSNDYKMRVYEPRSKTFVEYSGHRGNIPCATFSTVRKIGSSSTVADNVYLKSPLMNYDFEKKF